MLNKGVYKACSTIDLLFISPVTVESSFVENRCFCTKCCFILTLLVVFEWNGRQVLTYERLVGFCVYDAWNDPVRWINLPLSANVGIFVVQPEQKQDCGTSMLWLQLSAVQISNTRKFSYFFLEERKVLFIEKKYLHSLHINIITACNRGVAAVFLHSDWMEFCATLLCVQWTEWHLYLRLFTSLSQRNCQYYHIFMCVPHICANVWQDELCISHHFAKNIHKRRGLIN